MSIIKHVTLQKIVAHDFRYGPRICDRKFGSLPHAGTPYKEQVTQFHGRHIKVINLKVCLLLGVGKSILKPPVITFDSHIFTASRKCDL